MDLFFVTSQHPMSRSFLNGFDKCKRDTQGSPRQSINAALRGAYERTCRGNAIYCRLSKGRLF
jgi:hypothetical protein